MSLALILLIHSLKRVRYLVIVMGLLLAGFQVVLTLVANDAGVARGQLRALSHGTATVPIRASCDATSGIRGRCPARYRRYFQFQSI